MSGRNLSQAPSGRGLADTSKRQLLLANAATAAPTCVKRPRAAAVSGRPGPSTFREWPGALEQGPRRGQLSLALEEPVSKHVLRLPVE